MVQTLRELRVARIYLADTLGVYSLQPTSRATSDSWRRLGQPSISSTTAIMTTGWPHQIVLAAIQAGARGVHTSVNGMGERAGNTSLAEIVAAIHDHSDARTAIQRGSPDCAFEYGRNIFW